MYGKHQKRKGKAIKAVVFILLTVLVGVVTFSLCKYFNDQNLLNDKNAKTQQEIARVVALEAKKNEPVYIKLPGAKQIRAISSDYSKPDTIWTIVSKSYPISEDYIPSNLQIPDVPTRIDKSTEERSVRSDILNPIKTMFDSAKAAGHNLMIGSGYRSAAMQKVYYDNLTNSVGEIAANQAIAKPGQSEHQTGLAVDISTLSRTCYLDECFATTADGLWLADNSYKFGFILRYPEGMETITGYQYEPWHFRYVGIDLATAIHDSRLTFDQVWPYLISADKTLRKNGAI
jgi:zinc D-Ala-D-Ala carboxypeptidase